MKIRDAGVAVCVLALTVGTCATSSGDETSESPSLRAEQIATDLIAVMDLVLDRHVVPVTKQQMVHCCLSQAYLRSGRIMPGALVKEISAAADNDRFRTILQREITAMLDRRGGQEIGLAAALQAVGVEMVPAKEQQVNSQLAANRYVGIGITLREDKAGFPIMHSVVSGGPAHQAGAEANDLIIEVDGKNTAGIEINQAVDWLRGVEGSEVEIVLRHAGVDHTVTMTRGVVRMATVSKPLLSKSGETVGIKLQRVSASNVHELRAIHRELDEKVKTVVLDFRNAQGASNLHYGELLGNSLIDGETIGFVADRNGNLRRVEAELDSVFSGRKLVVIMDATTSGVLKWIAAALKDTGQAVLTGDPSPSSAMTTETMPFSDEMSVTMPVHVLFRGGGEQLFVASDLLAAGPRRPWEQQRVVAVGGRQFPVSGVLYPDNPFPFVPSLRRLPVPYQGLRPQDQVRDLKRLLDLIEKDSTASVSLKRGDAR